MDEVIAGVRIPDTQLVADATEFVRDRENDLLYHHSRRVFLFASLQGERRKLKADPELLYVATMFHDLGLTDAHRHDRVRFEINSADAARQFLRDHDVPEMDVASVWLSIALHATPGIPPFLEPVVALVTAGVELDVLGIDHGEFAPAVIAEVVASHPRPHFKQQILAAFTHANEARPETSFGSVIGDVLDRYSRGFDRIDFVDLVLDSDWPE